MTCPFTPHPPHSQTGFGLTLLVCHEQAYCSTGHDINQAVFGVR
jgi:hypothetical protein